MQRHFKSHDKINTQVHKGFGLSGTLTNGVMRDLGDLASDFQVLAGSIGPSHAFVHVVDFDQPVTVYGLEVAPGDFIHADRHGAVAFEVALRRHRRRQRFEDLDIGQSGGRPMKRGRRSGQRLCEQRGRFKDRRAGGRSRRRA